MSETIVLPRSGVVLAWTGFSYEAQHGATLTKLVQSTDADQWYAGHPSGYDEGGLEVYGTRDECISWLDSRVLELRAALMPADARERVARALFHADTGLCDSCLPGDMMRDFWYAQADAVLAALGGGK